MKFHYDQPSDSEEITPVPNALLDKAFERAQKILSKPIDPRDFKDYRDTDTDIAFVEQQESRYRKMAAQDTPEQLRARKFAKIFEAIILEQTEQANWLGENAATLQTSRYDDIVNKVDAVVEFTEGPMQASHLALAMDVTISGHFGEKFDHIKKTIDAGKLTEIKYFASEVLDIHGRKTNVPHVVLGVDRKTLYDVVAMWANGDTKALAGHPIQVKLLCEIETQLEAYQKYAASNGKAQLVPIYEKTLQTVREIIAEKGITADDRKEALRDEMFYSLKFSAEHLADRKTA